MAVQTRAEHTQQLSQQSFKGIVSRDFGGLQIILIDRICIPDVPL